MTLCKSLWCQFIQRRNGVRICTTTTTTLSCLWNNLGFYDGWHINWRNIGSATVMPYKACRVSIISNLKINCWYFRNPINQLFVLITPSITDHIFLTPLCTKYLSYWLPKCLMYSLLLICQQVRLLKMWRFLFVCLFVCSLSVGSKHFKYSLFKSIILIKS